MYVVYCGCEVNNNNNDFYYYKQTLVEEFFFQGDPTALDFLIQKGIITKVCAGGYIHVHSIITISTWFRAFVSAG